MQLNKQSLKELKILLKTDYPDKGFTDTDISEIGHNLLQIFITVNKLSGKSEIVPTMKQSRVFDPSLQPLPAGESSDLN